MSLIILPSLLYPDFKINIKFKLNLKHHLIEEEDGPSPGQRPAGPRHGRKKSREQRITSTNPVGINKVSKGSEVRVGN